MKTKTSFISLKSGIIPALLLATASFGITTNAHAQPQYVGLNGAACTDCHTGGAYSKSEGQAGLTAWCKKLYPTGTGAWSSSTHLCTVPSGPTATPTTKPATATPTTKPATATPTTKPATATPTTKPATATPTTLPATPTTKPATATPTTKPATSTPTPKPATSTPVPGPTSGKTVSGSVGSSTSGAAATDVFAVTCGRGTVGLDVGISDNTAPSPVSVLTIQAVKDGAANLITAGSAVVSTSGNDDDDDDHDHGSASQLNKGSGVYTVLVSRQLSDAVGAEVYSANVNCVGSSSKTPSTSYTIKQNQ